VRVEDDVGSGARDGRRGPELADHLAEVVDARCVDERDDVLVPRGRVDHADRPTRVEQEFGAGARVQVLLRPPVLRALGTRRKIRVGRSAVPLFRALRAARRPRGTPLDPFGRARVRRIERVLIPEYSEAMEDALAALSTHTAETVAAIAALPEQVRGYERIKLDSVGRYRATLSELLQQLEGSAVRATATAAPDRPTG
jgi:indolepyruvate ferredoxin oxidoreductase